MLYMFLLLAPFLMCGCIACSPFDSTWPVTASAQAPQSRIVSQGAASKRTTALPRGSAHDRTRRYLGGPNDPTPILPTPRDPGIHEIAALEINSCLARARVSGGICDARSIPAASFRQQITVDGGETLLLPSSGAWIWTGISDGQSCGIAVEGGGSLIGFGASNGGGFNKFELLTSGNVNMRGLLCANTTATPNYMRIEGEAIVLPQAGASFTKGAVDIEGWYDASVLRDLTVSLTEDPTPNQTALYVSGLCCSATIERVVADAGYRQGDIPAHITGPADGATTGAAVLISNSFDHPGSGENALLIDGDATGPITIVGQFSEGSRSDSTTPAWSVTATRGVAFVGGRVQMLIPSSAYCIDVMSASGNSISVSGGFSCEGYKGGRQNAINDHTTGLKIKSGENGVVSDYSTAGYTGKLMPEKRTVSALPSPEEDEGMMLMVTDSTEILREGQICRGSGTHKALAFSNGSVWKCF